MKPFFLLLLVPTLASLIAADTILSACAQAIEADMEKDSIGVAIMKEDGTIVLRLRAKAANGATGEGTLVYPPTHPEYQNILSHIGPIQKGQTVTVKPWPD
ncbi:MAG TPA: hypothetical protein VH851_10600 [Candidatus Binatia bacterium]